MISALTPWMAPPTHEAYEVEQFRREVSEFLAAFDTPELRREIILHGGRGGGALTGQLWAELGSRGYLGVSLPTKYGGAGRSMWYIDALCNEMSFREIPVLDTALLTIGPTLLDVGTDEQKAEFIPRIVAGDVDFALGYSEPQSGTDLASLKTTARLEGDRFVVNGQKVYTSRAEYAEYIWLAARTNPEAPRHRGISLLMIPTATPGVTVNRLETMGRPTNITFYDDVVVPASALVGELDRGWSYISQQLTLERIVISPVPELERLATFLLSRIEEGIGTPRISEVLLDVASNLTVFSTVRNEILRRHIDGHDTRAEASILKTISTESKMRLLLTALDAVGAIGTIRTGQTAAVVDSSGTTLESQLRSSVINLFGGGSNDLLRDLAARSLLGLPRY